MYTERQRKVGRLIQKELSEIFRKEISNIYPGKMISVTTTRVSPDLGLAKSYLSIFPSTDNEEVIKHISKISGQLRYQLGKVVGKQLRIVPELAFFVDDSLDYIENIEKNLDN
ncbi:MAG: 30S ribosome-binding factor RbfA [Marinifilaceae bacterium]|jgi:ribosome-binding factor A|nr:30S ribosome-binding factor RbfA [Marinifilaceae bacterium]